MKIMLSIVLLFGIINANNFNKNQVACSNGNMKGCYNLGLMYDEGDGVKQDNQKAVEYYGTACNQKFAPACYNAGLMYLYKIGNIKLGKWLFGEACKGGFEQGCAWHRKLDSEGY